MMAGMDGAAFGCDGATCQAPPGVAVAGLPVQRDVACHARVQGAPCICTSTSRHSPVMRCGGYPARRLCLPSVAPAHCNRFHPDTQQVRWQCRGKTSDLQPAAAAHPTPREMRVLPKRQQSACHIT